VSSVKRISGALEAGAGTTALGSRPAEYQSSRAAACRSVEAGDQSPDQAASGKRPAAVGRGQPADPVLLPAGCSADPWRWSGAAAERGAVRAAGCGLRRFARAETRSSGLRLEMAMGTRNPMSFYLIRVRVWINFYTHWFINGYKSIPSGFMGTGLFL
jgi:hypothetical protein